MSRSHRHEAAFMGRLTAGVTHELKNVLAIICESAGLMEDILKYQQDLDIPNRDRFLKSLSIIRAQIQRGNDLSTRLNRLAHSPDQEMSQADLAQLADQVVALSQRLARLQGVTIEMEPAPEEIPLSGNLVRRQMALFAAIDGFLEELKDGGVVRVSVRPEAVGGSVILAAEPSAGAPPVEMPRSFEAVQAVLGPEGGTLYWDQTLQQATLTLPATPPAGV